MIEPLVRFLVTLNPRERAMIALLLAVALPLALVQGLALPLLARQDAARLAVAEAEALRAWVQDRQAELALLPSPAAGTPTAPVVRPVGLGGIESALLAAGLRDAVVRLESPSGTTIALRFDEVPFTELMQWLDASETAMGYTVNVLRVARGPFSGTVAAEMQLEPRL